MTEDHPAYAVLARESGWRLRVWVQPGVRATEVAGMHGDFLKIRLRSPAVDNKANAALAEFVALIPGLKGQQVVLESGHGSRQKTLFLHVTEEPDWTIFPHRA